MHSTHLRREHIHGALLGTAIGDAIGSSYAGLSSNSVRRLAAQDLSYRFPRFFAFYGEDTRMMLLSAQALLNSRSEMETFRASFSRRMIFYALSLPPGLRASHLVSGLRSMLSYLGVKPATQAASMGPATRAIFATLAINGGGHRTQKWIEESTKLTHSAPEVIEVCSLLSLATQAAIDQPSEPIDASSLLTGMKDQVSGPTWALLKKLAQDLAQGVSPQSAKCNTTSCPLMRMTLQSLYCWLTPRRTLKAHFAMQCNLGGDTHTRGAIVGGLAGSHLGVEALPERLVFGLQGWPHGPEWLEQLANRFSHWPMEPTTCIQRTQKPRNPCFS